MAYPDRKIQFPPPAPLTGVVFPTGRRAVGRSGWDVARFCQNIIREAGSIQKALFLDGESAEPQSAHAKGEYICSPITLLWSNPRVSLVELCPELSQITNGQE